MGQFLLTEFFLLLGVYHKLFCQKRHFREMDKEDVVQIYNGILPKPLKRMK